MSEEATAELSNDEKAAQLEDALYTDATLEGQQAEAPPVAAEEKPAKKGAKKPCPPKGY